MAHEDASSNEPGSARRFTRVPVLLIILFVLALAIAIAAPISVNYIGHRTAPMAGAVAFVALVTFSSVLYYLTGIRDDNLAESFRHTIAATFMIVYLLLVTYNTFFSVSRQIPLAV